MSDPVRTDPLTAPFTGAPLPDQGDDIPEPPRLRALRRLVTGLTLTLIFGVITIAGALVVRISGGGPVSPPVDVGGVTAEALTLPAGERITVTGGSGTTLLIVTEDASGRERLHLIDGTTGAVLRSMPINRTAP